MAMAAENEEQANATQLDKQIVTATRSNESLATLPYTVQVVSQDQIALQAQAGVDLGTVLGRLVPGLAPGDNSATSFYQSLRGRKVLVLIDGVAQRTNKNVSRELTSISTANIERVEIVSGASAMYGAGATGGVINIITKKGQDEEPVFKTEVGMTTSTENTDDDQLAYNVAQSVSGKKGKLDYYLGAAYDSRGHFIDSHGDQIATDPNQVGRDNTDALDLMFNGGYQISSTKRVTVGAEYYNEEMDTDYAADFGDPDDRYLGLPEGFLGAGGLYDPQPIDGLSMSQQPSTERQSLTLNFSDQNFLGQVLNSQLNYRKGDYYYYPYYGAPLYLETNWAAARPIYDAVLAMGETQENALAYALLESSDAKSVITQSRIETEAIDLKIALDSEINLNGRTLSLTYGLDYIVDSGKQTSTEYDYDAWYESGQTQYNPTGNIYQAGPSTDSETQAVFLQSAFPLTDELTLRAGVRHEKITVEVDDYISGEDVVNAAIYSDQIQGQDLQLFATHYLGLDDSLASQEIAASFLESVVSSTAGSLGASDFMTYSDTVSVRKGGEEEFSATLLNAGLVYDFNTQQQMYFNFSQGFTVPDMSRLLRSVSVFSDVNEPGPVLDSTNVDAIKTDSFDLGWRGQFDTIQAQASLYYNVSDKYTHFDKVTGVVELRDQTEKVWGFEGSINAHLTDNISTGATYAYTYGETETETNGWEALPVDRISPQKITSHLTYNNYGSFSVALQMLQMLDTDKAHKDNVANAEFEGYTTFDLLTQFALPKGQMGIAISNLANESYQPLYNQVRAYPSTGASTDLPAQGRTLSVNYSVEY
jgi:iron complex outermembrane receptor protein